MKFKRYRVTVGNRWDSESKHEFYTLNGATRFYCQKKQFGSDVFRWDRKIGWRWIFGTKAPTMYQFRNK
jgi:hypothetical protein